MKLVGRFHSNLDKLIQQSPPIQLSIQDVASPETTGIRNALTIASCKEMTDSLCHCFENVLNLIEQVFMF